jgi:hypothetical protein
MQVNVYLHVAVDFFLNEVPRYLSDVRLNVDGRNFRLCGIGTPFFHLPFIGVCFKTNTCFIV